MVILHFLFDSLMTQKNNFKKFAPLAAKAVFVGAILLLLTCKHAI
jgi:hypothetical protein